MIVLFSGALALTLQDYDTRSHAKLLSVIPTALSVARLSEAFRKPHPNRSLQATACRPVIC